MEITEPSPFKKIVNSRLFLLSAAGVFYFLFLFFTAQKHFNGNMTGFLAIGKGVASGPCPQVLDPDTFIWDSNGYDGQFYYYIALDPFIKTDIHYCTDGGAYRYQRILLPLLSSILSGGNKKIIPYAIVGINLLSILAGTYFVSKFCEHFNAPRWFCLFYAFSTALILSVVRSTVDPLGLCLIIVGFYYYVVDKNLLKSSIAFTFAVLSKEVALISVVSVLCFDVIKNKNLNSLKYFIYPFIAYSLWQSYIYAHFGVFSLQVGPAARSYGNLIPFKGLFEKIWELFQASNLNALFSEEPFKIFLLLNISFAVFAAVLSFFHKFESPFQVLAILYIGLYSSFSAKLGWTDFWGYPRHTAELFLSLILIYLYQKKIIYLIPVFLNSAAAIVIALTIMVKRP